MKNFKGGPKVIGGDNLPSLVEIGLTLFLPGEGGISPLIVYHVTKLVRNRVKGTDNEVWYILT